ncbi:putative FtsX-related transmembrane transport protein [Fulvivirga imtechensis AK7]|uniref:Putative FtsX-related transmembrane transport protein n=1 Tax=Fulvivirga imtechensis AK7 TaxID=1237149 RepID=L8JN43_9BACT|nr:ABC transporter permease [Fulvivirga imtechensis]ELR70356.1 putative FtsX-related transmembrane transport protein [Fulvivirga imtechensis AK7]
MIKNYLKIAVRNLLRFKAYAGINLLGLALGLTVGVLILLFVQDELSFDKFHENKDRIYRVVTRNPAGGGMDTNGWPVGIKLKEEFPEVEEVVYLKGGSFLEVNHEGKKYHENIKFSSPGFLKVFSFEMREGNLNQALMEPNSIVITEKIRDKYFGQTEVLGKTMILGDTLDFQVAGVLANVPSQSHIQFDILLPMTAYQQINPFFDYHSSEGWGNINVFNYVLLKDGTDLASISAKAKHIYMDNVGEWLNEMGMELYVGLEPLGDVYIRSDIGNRLGPKGALSQVYLVSAIAIFVILLACINFINLTTARAVYRAKEVGLRKIVGSTRSSLFWQFLSESFVLTLMAFFLVALLIDIILPFFNVLMDKSYEIGNFLNLTTLGGVAILVILITVLSGYYPAWVLSGYKPAEVLKGRMQTSRKGVKLRRTLVVFQFFISAGLVLGTLVVLQQLNYMRDQDLGFEKEQILVIDASHTSNNFTGTSHEIFINAMHSQAVAQQITFTNALPGRPGWQGQWAFPEGFMKGENVTVEYMSIDEHYIETLGLEIIAGNNFDRSRGAELKEGVIINETAVREMRWETPENAIGKTITSPSGYPEGTVIGVVKDYHGLGLQNRIWPKVMDYNPQASRYFAIRFNTGSTADLVTQISGVWESHFPDDNFDYFFLDEDFDKQYRAEERLMNVMIIFAVLTIIIASVGLFGLVSFMIVTRTKEIGVRKVLGAGVWSITSMLSKEFLLLVMIANLIAIPLIWYFGNQWLESFAYRMTLQPDIFIITLVATLIIAFLTVSYKTVKAAMINPAETLRNE